MNTVEDKMKFWILFPGIAVKNGSFFTEIITVVFRTILAKRPTPLTETVKSG